MSPYPWIKVATDLPDHPKAAALARRLGDPRAWSYVVALWLYAARYYPSGALPDDPDVRAALEAAARWNGEPGALAEALIEARVLERRRRRLVVHGWDEWQRPHMDKAAEARARLRKFRARKRREKRANAPDSQAMGNAPVRVSEGVRVEERREEEDPAGAAPAGARDSTRLPGTPPEPLRPLPSTGSSPASADPREAQVVAMWNQATGVGGCVPCEKLGNRLTRELQARLSEPGWFESLPAAFAFLTSNGWHRDNPIQIATLLRPGRAQEYVERVAERPQRAAAGDWRAAAAKRAAETSGPEWGRVVAHLLKPDGQPDHGPHRETYECRIVPLRAEVETVPGGGLIWIHPPDEYARNFLEDNPEYLSAVTKAARAALGDGWTVEVVPPQTERAAA